MPPAILLVRAGVLATTNTFASIALGLAIYVLYLGLYPPNYVPTVIAAAFHLFSVTTMVVISRARTGAFTSRVSFEVGWLSFLCVLWLAASLVVLGFIARVFLCTDFSVCVPIQVMVVLSFVNALILLGYVTTLIVVAVAARKAGRNIWSSDVKEIQGTQGSNNHGRENFIPPPNTTVVIYPPVGNPNYNVPPVMSQPPPYYQQQHGWPQA